ncbi:MAG TPA: hypothetical protein VH134_17750 [Candidatus Dormibacteraeota bacterium]|nr:hypothetical protein [Candidatus Dormibacteraeota bacterium]
MVMRRRWARAGLTALAGLLALAGCGSAPASRTGPTTSPGATLAPSSAPASTGSADELYAGYLAALRSARSEHYAGTVAFSDGTSVTIDVTATQTTAHLIAHTQGIALEEIVAGDRVYQRGGAHGPDWVVLPPAEAVTATALTMKREADCASREHGHLTLGPRTRVGGLLVATLIDDGRAAGAAPQKAYVTVDPPVRLVRVMQTGPQTAGGGTDCGHEAGPVAVSAQVEYDRFDSAVQITPPPHPTDLGAGQTA